MCVSDEVYLAVKKAYENENIPQPYPAANKHLQHRLNQFVTKGNDFFNISHF